MPLHVSTCMPVEPASTWPLKTSRKKGLPRGFKVRKMHEHVQGVFSLLASFSRSNAVSRWIPELSRSSLLKLLMFSLIAGQAFSQELKVSDLEKEVARLEKQGLAPGHPRIISLKRQIESGKVDPPTKDAKVEPSKSAYDFSAEVYGEKIQAIGVLVQIPPTADPVEAEEKIIKLYSVLSLPEQRKKIISMHPAKLGVLVLIRPDDGADFYAVLRKQKDFYGIQAGDPGKLYQWHCK